MSARESRCRRGRVSRSRGKCASTMPEDRPCQDATRRGRAPSSPNRRRPAAHRPIRSAPATARPERFLSPSRRVESRGLWRHCGQFARRRWAGRLATTALVLRAMHTPTASPFTICGMGCLQQLSQGHRLGGRHNPQSTPVRFSTEGWRGWRLSAVGGISRRRGVAVGRPVITVAPRPLRQLGNPDDAPAG